jgi:hypothetical protein
MNRRAGEPPRWSSWREVPGVIFHPPHLRKTVQTAVIVGTVLFGINHLDVVLRGAADHVLWLNRLQYRPAHRLAALEKLPDCVLDGARLIVTDEHRAHHTAAVDENHGRPRLHAIALPHRVLRIDHHRPGNALGAHELA